MIYCGSINWLYIFLNIKVVMIVLIVGIIFLKLFNICFISFDNVISFCNI